MLLPRHLAAFVHVDMDNLWAIANCYGISIPERLRNYVYEDALRRFLRLFETLNIRATFFVNGSDLEIPGNAEILGDLVRLGHGIANHSYSHRLDFRMLGEEGIEEEVLKTHRLIESACGVTPLGFRAPGYGFSMRLLRVLARCGYRYDSSLMPSPYGFVFRILDSALRRRGRGSTGTRKTQYSRLREGMLPVGPYCVSLDPGGDEGRVPRSILEVPVAASPLLRLPFQAGVCLALGRSYFDAHLYAYRKRPALPLVFLMHGADLTDFRALGIPFFAESRWFSTEIDQKVSSVIYCMTKIKAAREVQRVEAWAGLREMPVCQPD